MNRVTWSRGLAPYFLFVLLGCGPTDEARDTAHLASPSTGEACEPGSPPRTCYLPPLRSPVGTTLCARGAQYCRDGLRSQCESLVHGYYDLEQVRDGVGVAESALISDPTGCNPCSPDCFIATDRPVTGDLTQDNSIDVSYDAVQAGLRLRNIVEAAQRGPLEDGAVCGDGVLEGVEMCDDANVRDADGCSAACLLEAGFFCPLAGAACQRSVCGNGAREGLEQCDDANLAIGDGCTHLCTVEPNCSAGACMPACGDGKVLPGEACDDGNTRSGDGCSAACQLEAGYTCTLVTSTPPTFLDLPIVYRDFWQTVHPDFEHVNAGLTKGMVANTWGADKKPVPLVPNKSLTTAANFNQWYNEVPGVNITIADTIRVTRQTDGSYAFDSTSFFPLTNKGWALRGEPQPSGKNFSFTSEVRFWFQYEPGQKLTFRGDDDVWVFINGQLAVDIGGVHSASSASIVLNASTETSLGLVPGKLYEAAVFQAERHTNSSNYRLQLSNFFFGRTECKSVCGDGILTPDEFCDDGSFNGDAGACLPSCQGRAPKFAAEARYWRDYTAAETCEMPPERPLWGNLNWKADAVDGSITLELRAAETAEGLNSAPPLSVPLPAHSVSGSFDVRAALLAAGLRFDAPYVRVTAILRAPTDLKSTPWLREFDVSHTCVNAE